MATLTDITTSVQTVTATGPVTPTTGLDISGVSGDATVVVEVSGLTAGKTARIQLEDTVNAFTAATALAVINVTGQIDGRSSDRYTWRKYQLPNNVFGSASAKLRANVTALDAGATLSLHAWLEQ
jgi:hypothetical protein